jgi:hypothetical protein
MHWIQHNRRRGLRRRVASGEVDLEALGIKRLTVPSSVLQGMPLFVYESGGAGLATLTNQPTRESQPKSNQSSRTIQSPSPTAITASPVSREPSLNTQYPSPLLSSRTRQSQRRSPSPSLPRRSPPFSQSSCPICLEDFVSSHSIVRGLPCGHDFHPGCVDTFLRERSSLCPMCKKSVLPRGYCPDKLTNAMVRRERIMRRMRERVVVDVMNGPGADATEQQRPSILGGQRGRQRSDILGVYFDRVASSPQREVAVPLNQESAAASLGHSSTSETRGPESPGTLLGHQGVAEVQETGMVTGASRCKWHENLFC